MAHLDKYALRQADAFAAFEIGEVRNGKVQLEHHAIAAGQAAGLEPVLVLVNDQKFTKTANCWDVDNNAKGTNTNRVVFFQKSNLSRVTP